MTYCLGILLPTGLVMASDSRSNAGIDQVAKVCKLATITTPGDRVIVILSAGNLATTQAVVTSLQENGDETLVPPVETLRNVRTMFEAARLVGQRLRETMDRDAKYVEPFGDASASFIVGGQIKGEPPRLFQVYSAGNFIEAGPRACFLQIGETKYGKPILDRALSGDLGIEEAAKLALLSFDATLRSNLSVGLPIDMLRYAPDSFSADNLVTFEEHDDYFRTLRQGYAVGLTALVNGLPAPQSR